MLRSFLTSPPARVQCFQGKGSAPDYATPVHVCIPTVIKSAIMVSTQGTQCTKYELVLKVWATTS